MSRSSRFGCRYEPHSEYLDLYFSRGRLSGESSGASGRAGARRPRDRSSVLRPGVPIRPATALRPYRRAVADAGPALRRPNDRFVQRGGPGVLERQRHPRTQPLRADRNGRPGSRIRRSAVGGSRSGRRSDRRRCRHSSARAGRAQWTGGPGGRRRGCAARGIVPTALDPRRSAHCVWNFVTA